MTSPELSKTFEPTGIEERWYSRWEAAGYFHVEASDARPPFTIVIPPPNVTGVLHMGHALDNTLQDILIRYKRMDGFAALWVPGTDHAGIATQNVVEKQLLAEGISRHDLGREKFLERVWAWKAESGGKIVEQLRRLGSSCDWKRERFTMDEGLSRAVRRVFVSLYKEGLIYRSKYLISWCPRCLTALSDLEVEHADVDGTLTHFKYEAPGGISITVATTRPETMLGDTAIAVHPKDSRYSKLIGKMVRHPFLDREIPIISDDAVDPKFGTGAVKVTPAHDPTDYAMGQRHQLTFITILNDDGRMSAEAGPYQGLDRFEARKRVVADLTSNGLLEKVEPYKHSVGHCQRCHTVVEPRISEQWFVKIASLAEPAAKAVEDGRTKFVPENWTKTYLDWMTNIRDWCISRQLWWGHRIPVWYCQACSAQTCATEDPTACESCGSKEIRQDPDVLDTWFSSALWPFSTLGWPEPTADLKKFYPTTVLVTGFDIIFFWVARMMMMGVKFMKEVPFQTVHIHALIRDEKGQKMSKSKGNVIDPLVIMDKFGTDAFRFALTSFAVQGRDIMLSEQRIAGYRNFMNKIWNASRFALSMAPEAPSDLSSSPTTLPDRWILGRLNEVTKTVRLALDEMRFSEAAEALYQFIWHEYCDWYLEMIKPHFREGASAEDRASSQRTLLRAMDGWLRLLHPICPFITEEIWQRLPFLKTTESIMMATYPKIDAKADASAAEETEVVQRVVTALRNIRAEHQIPPSKRLAAFVRTPPGKSGATLQVLSKHVRYVQALAQISELSTSAPSSDVRTAASLIGDLEVFLSLAADGDAAAERERLEKERKKALEDVAFLERRLEDESYRAKAPPQLIQKDEAKLSQARLKLENLQQSLKGLS